MWGANPHPQNGTDYKTISHGSGEMREWCVTQSNQYGSRLHKQSTDTQPEMSQIVRLNPVGSFK